MNRARSTERAATPAASPWSPEVVLTGGPLTGTEADLLVVPAFGGSLEGRELRALDRATGGVLFEEASLREFAAKPEESLLLQTHGSLPARNILVVGCGNAAQPATWYALADSARHTARQLRARTVLIEPTRRASRRALHILAEGFALAGYRFARYRPREENEQPPRLLLRVPATTNAAEEGVRCGILAAGAVCRARDLINTPATEMTPRALAREARRLTRLGLEVRVHEKRALEALGMGGLLGVARGSAEPPCFIEILYKPPVRARAAVALAGKGITFDSGGLSLKPSEAMRIQKRDMAGGAAILGAMSALPALRPPCEVRGYIPAAENMPGGRALKPGDVVRSFNGKTIEVLNTDAEGRLLLADALAYAVYKEPDILVDLATLTAAVNSALGSRYAAILGTDRKLVRACIAAGAEADERLWELPLVPEYRRDLDSQVADMKNVGEGQASTIVGALFLREFVGEVPWVHIDFASTAFTSSGYACHPTGATGFGVRTILRLLMRQ